jgi:hypothetical protein
VAVVCAADISEECAASILRVEVTMKEFFFRLCRQAALTHDLSGTCPSVTRC